MSLQNSLKIYLRQFWVSCTLRSWVHKILSHYKTVSQRLGEICVSTCSSNSFPHTKYMSTMRGKSSESHLDVSLFSNPQEKVWKARKTLGPICSTVFMTFFPQLETNDALLCSSDSFPCMVMYILCVKNCPNYIWTHSCLTIAGRLFYNVTQFHWPRSAT